MHLYPHPCRQAPHPAPLPAPPPAARNARKHPPGMAAGHGLTELLVVLLVLAVLAGLAAPALQAWALELQLQTTLDELARGLALARTEALATGRVVEFRYRPLPSGQRLSINRSGILFGPSGNATPGTLTLCDRRGMGRSLVVARSGRVRIASAQCGFALAEVLVALVLLAGASLALAQSVLQARHTVVETALHATALDAAAAAAEGSRLLGPQSGFPADATLLVASWRATYAGNGTTPALVLGWQPVPGAALWQTTAATGGVRLALEVRP